ncbi:MAG: hypothetical protein AAFV59_16475 [Pseudomonadota bacterium]
MFLYRMKRFVREEQGSITVEFILSVPLLLLGLSLAFATFHAYLQYSRSSKALYTVADMISRHQFLTTGDVEQYKSLHEALTASPSGSVIRVSRLDYIDKIESPELAEDSDGFETSDGFYEVTSSESYPEIEDEIWCSDDLTVSCPAADVLRYPLQPERLRSYTLPFMGDGSHVILIETFTPYAAPIAAGYLGLPAFDSINWSSHVFAWPRNINGLTFVVEDGGSS